MPGVILTAKNTANFHGTQLDFGTLHSRVCEIPEIYWFNLIITLASIRNTSKRETSLWATVDNNASHHVTKRP